MAAPHVAGVGALLTEMGCDRGEAIDILTSTSRVPLTDERGVWDPRYGYGIVDAQAGVAAAAESCERDDDGDGNGNGNGNGKGGPPDHAGGPPGNPGPPENPGPPGGRDNADGAASALDEGLLTSYVTLLHIGR